MEYSFAYLKMLVILAAIIMLLLYVKKILEKKNLLNQNKNDLVVKSQKMIDTKNRVALLGYKDKEYLVILGDNNLLLDSFDSYEKVAREQDEKTNNN
ncbi:MAG TPA: hypothetical protein EYG69_02765 [Campylobacterales bacterium]|nr:hypothetical protein [Campylobacterales bacterium]